jgi:hypothetical protein
MNTTFEERELNGGDFLDYLSHSLCNQMFFIRRRERWKDRKEGGSETVQKQMDCNSQYLVSSVLLCFTLETVIFTGLQCILFSLVENPI